MGMFQKLNDEGKTIVVITHEDDIARHCKRKLYFRDGMLESDTKILEKDRLFAPQTIE